MDGGGAVGPGFLEGRLDVGEAHATPVIRALRRELPGSGVVVLDAPPGASCPVVETLRGADLVILVTEPTPFGLSDLEQAIGVVRAVAGEAVVVVNRTGMTEKGDEAAWRLCEREGLSVPAAIPEDRAVAACSARGHSPVLAVDGYAARLAPLVELVRERIRE
jgi:MinD superfamily P-loop ATPase